MPKKMFFNIPESKRKMFLEVAVDEFTTKPFEQVSVNTIIKKANISRGSFYTYFDDLEALFNYIFREVKAERISYAKKLIKDSQGHYFEFIKKLFLYDFDAYSKQGTYSLFRNYIRYIQTTKKTSLKETLLKDDDVDINQIFNMNELKIEKDELLDLIEIVVIIMINTFIKYENDNMSKEATITLFNKRMNLLQYGTRKA